MQRFICSPILAILFLVTSTHPTYAEVITRCGASQGYAYYFSGGYVPADKSGWTEDTISPGSLSLTINGEEVDLIFSDASGIAKSSKAEGATVQLLAAQEAGTIIVISAYPGGALEHYFFRLNESGGEVIWGSLKWNGMVDKSSLYRAECRAP